MRGVTPGFKDDPRRQPVISDYFYPGSTCQRLPLGELFPKASVAALPQITAA